MSARRRPLGRGVTMALRAGVGVVIVGITLLIAAQHLSGSISAWLEFSRYLPYVTLLLPALAALVASFWLGWFWRAASVGNLALLLTLGMGLQWNRGEAGAEQVRLMTWNVKVANVTRERERVQSLAVEVLRYDPDIVVMQDATGLLGTRNDPALPFGPVFGLPHVHAVGQYVIASRFSLRECTAPTIGLRGDNLQYLRCTVDVRGLALDLVNVHFQSPREGLNAASREGLDGADDWIGNYVRRLAQSRSLAQDLARSRRPLIVAGDLNAIESSPVIQMLLGIGLQSAFSSAGRGYGYTHGRTLRLGHDFLRIDHVLAGPDFGVADSFVGQSNATDHRPVIANLVLRR